MRKNYRIEFAVFILTAALAAPANAGKRACDLAKDQASEWIAAFLAQEDRAPDYSALRQLPTDLMRHVYSQLAPETQYEFWTAHMTSISLGLAKEEQVATIQQALDALNVEMFSRGLLGGPDANREERTYLAEMLRTSFSPEEVALISTLPKAGELKIDGQTLVVNCTCAASIVEDECFSIWICVQGAQDCSPVAGCGTFAGDYCDGMCCRNGNPNVCY